jgi:hypothetical protein
MRCHPISTLLPTFALSFTLGARAESPVVDSSGTPENAATEQRTVAPRVAPAEPASSPAAGGFFYRMTAGASYFRGTTELDGERHELSAPAFSMPISVGYAHHSVAVHFDADLDTGPSPTLRVGDDVVQNPSITMSRYHLGLGATGYLGRSRAWSLFASAGYSALTFETNDRESDVVGFVGGFAVRAGVGLDFFRNDWGALGFASSVRFVRYRDDDRSTLAAAVVDAGLMLTLGRGGPS